MNSLDFVGYHPDRILLITPVRTSTSKRIVYLVVAELQTGKIMIHMSAKYEEKIRRTKDQPKRTSLPCPLKNCSFL